MKSRKRKHDPVVGIDVSKDTLDAGVLPSGEEWTSGQSPEEISAMADRIAALKPALVVLEATGGLELPVVYALVERGVPVHRAEPRRARYFARAVGLLAKSDRIDKFGLARFGASGELAPQTFPAEGTRQLDALTTRRRQLVEAITAETNRLGATTDPEARASIERHLAWLRGELKALEAQIEACQAADPETCAKVERLCSVPGVGKVTAAVLLSALPELGTLDRWQAAGLSGTAPLNDDSGKRQGKRRTWGGRKDARCALYMAALVGTRFNPVLRDVYVRLLAEGKEKKVALTACMRKLVVILNAMLRDGTTWRPTAPAAA
ncbi:MAG: IS110 family transposase [Gammaproteobacteria bacterium]|nr:IS110 family transposase [Gammaproteobacteria bacterium]